MKCCKTCSTYRPYTTPKEMNSPYEPHSFTMYGRCYKHGKGFSYPVYQPDLACRDHKERKKKTYEPDDCEA